LLGGGVFELAPAFWSTDDIGSITVRDGLFRDNFAGASGGVFLSVGSFVTLEGNVTAFNNTAAEGGVFAGAGRVQVVSSSSRFVAKRNHAAFHGGVFALDSKTDASGVDGREATVLEENDAIEGAAISVGEGTSSEIVGIRVANHRAGSVVVIGGGSSVLLRRVESLKNVAFGDGAFAKAEASARVVFDKVRSQGDVTEAGGALLFVGKQASAELVEVDVV